MDLELSALIGDSASVRSSRREVKLPSKFSDFKPTKGSIFMKREEDQSSSEASSPKKSPQKSPIIVASSSRSLSLNSSDVTDRYKCDDCDKYFKKKSHLDEHTLIHLGEKPFILISSFVTVKMKSHLKTRIHKLDMTQN